MTNLEYLLARLCADIEKTAGRPKAADIRTVLGQMSKAMQEIPPSNYIAPEILNAAKSIYEEYPTECLKPEFRYVGKSKDDIIGLASLVSTHGVDAVREAVRKCAEKGKFIPDLCNFIKKFDTYKPQPERVTYKDY